MNATPLPAPRPGDERKHHYNGFPLFSTADRARVVTADPWAYLLHLAEKTLPRADEQRAMAFIEQAGDFYANAARSNSAGKPLLYYYAFLNLFKAALLVKHQAIPQVLKHGISDPRANSRQRLRLAGQQLVLPNRAHDRSEFFPELLHALGWGGACNRRWKVVDLLALIPSIHRTYCVVESSTPSFLPILKFSVASNPTGVWGLATFSTVDRDAGITLPVLQARRKFNHVFYQVATPTLDQVTFETRHHTFQAKDRASALRSLAFELRSLGLASILTSSGYRYYISTTTPANYMPRLAAAYAVFFYLGSITRYKPYDFDKIVAGKYRWIVEELLATEPNQLLYATCSWLAEAEVVRPYAVVQ